MGFLSLSIHGHLSFLGAHTKVNGMPWYEHTLMRNGRWSLGVFLVHGVHHSLCSMSVVRLLHDLIVDSKVAS